MTADEAFEQFAQLVDLHQAAARRHEQAYIDGLPDTVVASLYHEAVDLGEQATSALGLFLELVDKEAAMTYWCSTCQVAINKVQAANSHQGHAVFEAPELASPDVRETTFDECGHNISTGTDVGEDWCAVCNAWRTVR